MLIDLLRVVRDELLDVDLSEPDLGQGSCTTDKFTVPSCCWSIRHAVLGRPISVTSGPRLFTPVRVRLDGRSCGPYGLTGGGNGVSDNELLDLRARAAAGDGDAVDELVQLAGERGDMDELRRLADAGSADAVDELVQLAGERGDMDELRRLVGAGSGDAAGRDGRASWGARRRRRVVDVRFPVCRSMSRR